MDELEALVSIRGESGEFHTVVVDGPIFNDKVLVFSGQHERDGYVFLDVKLDK